MLPEWEGAEAIADVFACLQHVRTHADEYRIDPARLGIGGDSAGGNLAATCALLARNAGIPLVLQLLVYPIVVQSAGVICCESMMRNRDAP